MSATADPLGIATPGARPRCRFGHAHAWASLHYTEDGRAIPDTVTYFKCWTCGRIESDSPAPSGIP